MNNKKRLLILTIIVFMTLTSVNAYNIEENSSYKEHNKQLDTLFSEITKNYTLNSSNFTLLTMKNNDSEDLKEENSTARLDKSRPIYFAMDHVNSNDEEIRDTIINKLRSEGFNVVSAEIGPNKMSNNTIYLYEHNVTNAIIFHLFNGVDPSTIRELGTNGSDNRGKVVRSNGNDVVLAWFYDSLDCVNEDGSGVSYVQGSETGPSLENPKQYMEENDIIAICTSSDMGKHKDYADYTGEKTVNEFIKLFED